MRSKVCESQNAGRREILAQRNFYKISIYLAVLGRSMALEVSSHGMWNL